MMGGYILPDGQKLQADDYIEWLGRRVLELQSAAQRQQELIDEAYRCLTLIGHVPRSANTWAARCQAATTVLGAALAADSE